MGAQAQDCAFRAATAARSSSACLLGTSAALLPFKSLLLLLRDVKSLHAHPSSAAVELGSWPGGTDVTQPFCWQGRHLRLRQSSRHSHRKTGHCSPSSHLRWAPGTSIYLHWNYSLSRALAQMWMFAVRWEECCSEHNPASSPQCLQPGCLSGPEFWCQPLLITANPLYFTWQAQLLHPVPASTLLSLFHLCSRVSGHSFKLDNLYFFQIHWCILHHLPLPITYPWSARGQFSLHLLPSLPISRFLPTTQSASSLWLCLGSWVKQSYHCFLTLCCIIKEEILPSAH